MAIRIAAIRTRAMGGQKGCVSYSATDCRGGVIFAAWREPRAKPSEIVVNSGGFLKWRPTQLFTLKGSVLFRNAYSPPNESNRIPDDVLGEITVEVSITGEVFGCSVC